MSVYPTTQKKTGKTVRNSYQVVLRIRGRRTEKTVKGTKKDALAFEARWRLEVEAAKPTDTRVVPTFSSFCVGRYRKYAEMHLKQDTWSNRQYQLNILNDHFGDFLLTQIGTKEVEGYQAARLLLGIGAVKINDDVKALKAVLNYARSIMIPAAEPKAKPLPERGAKKRVLVWDEDDVATLYKAFAKESPELLPITVALLNTGMRKGEALALEWTSIDLKRSLIKISPSEYWQPKDNEPREIPIGSALMPWLMGTRTSERWVFPCSTGERYAKWPQKKWDRAREASKVGGSPHVCRHTYASHFLRKQQDLFLLAKVLGHSHARVTELYLHLLPDHLERARNAVVLPVPIGLEVRPTSRPASKSRKLADETVLQLRDDYANGISQKDIAAKYRLALSTINSIVKGKTYAEVLQKRG